MFETIIVPLDGSELAEAALTPALELNKRLGSRLLLLRAIESEAQRLTQAAIFADQPAAAAANVEMVEKVVAAEREEATQYLAALKQRLGGEARVETMIGEGPAADVIKSTAVETPGALIVMSSHGRGGLGRLVFGSVADAVLRESGVPVLLLRSQESGKS
jgi:nucleotide-binding universal stress UspA family protein